MVALADHPEADDGEVMIEGEREPDARPPHDRKTCRVHGRELVQIVTLKGSDQTPRPSGVNNHASAAQFRITVSQNNTRNGCLRDLWRSTLRAWRPPRSNPAVADYSAGSVIGAPFSFRK